MRINANRSEHDGAPSYIHQRRTLLIAGLVVRMRQMSLVVAATASASPSTKVQTDVSGCPSRERSATKSLPGPPSLFSPRCMGSQRPRCVRSHLAPSDTKSLASLVRGGEMGRKRDEAVAVVSGGSRSKIVKTKTGGSTVAASVFNLVNNVAGAGILTLAAGKAAGTGWIPSIVICASLAALSAHTFSLIGKACDMTGEKNFTGLWSQAFGSDTAHIVSLIVFLQGSASQIIYSGMLGDIFTALFGMMGVPDAVNSRTSNIVLLTSIALWPLCLLRNLSALAFTSVLGFSAVMYTVLFIAYRSMDGSYSLEPVGRFIADDVITRPSFAKSSMWHMDFTSLVLVSNLGLAYIAHYNAPTYWRELRGATKKKFSTMVGIAYAILATIYITAMCTGYATFGDECKGNILLNYHPKDFLSTLGRFATGFSILFGFPLVNNGAREGLKSFAAAFGNTALSEPKNHVALATTYLSFITLVSVSVRDVRLVVGLAGAAFGSFLVYICPALLYTKIVAKVNGVDSTEYKRARGNLALVPFGLFCGAMGVSMTIREALKRAGKI